MAFEVFKKGSAPVSTVPSVTIQKRGLLSLNKTAAQMLAVDGGDEVPEGVELLWDADRRVIGIRSAPLTNPNAYPLRPQGQKASGPFLIAGTLFTKYIGIDTSEARRWVPKLENDILIVDLNAESGMVAGPGRRSRAELEGETRDGAADDGETDDDK
ncbi:hypothetical protein [Nocardioides sp.]|uniref:hypothetical protein n=1 Tax=Nocardioides sp. TaxID=35761 RepID=UPI0037841A10